MCPFSLLHLAYMLRSLGQEGLSIRPWPDAQARNICLVRYLAVEALRHNGSIRSNILGRR